MKLTSDNVTQNTAQAAQWLKQGQLLAYPTESVWGIGCDAYNKKAVEQILNIKHRPSDKGMIVVTDSVQRIVSLLADLPEHRRYQIIESWANYPKGLNSKTNDNTYHKSKAKVVEQQQKDENYKEANNLVMGGCRQAVTWLLPLPNPTNQQPFPVWITGKHDSIAVRVIAHPLIAQLCQQLVSSTNPYGLIVSTSCNPSGQIPASSIDTAYNYFGENIKYLNGDTLGYRLPSQIRDAITGEVVR